MADTQEPTLRVGDQSVDGWVEYLQTLLNGWGFPIAVDGDFGQGTLGAVTGFQGQHHLLVDGVVGNQTWAALQEEAAEPVGTDGLAPHTFVESGPEARWLTEHDLTAGETMIGRAFNTGIVPIADGQFTAEGTVTFPDGSVQGTTMVSKSFNGQPVQPGEMFEFEGRFFNPIQFNQPGKHVLEAIMASELGGDRAVNELDSPGFEL
jgi:hypothetical protein